MFLKIALLLSMIIQLIAAIIAVSLIRRTRYNVSWILISSGFVLMAFRRLFEFSSLFWETKLVSKDDINSWIGVVISLLLFFGLIYIRQIFNLQERIEKLREKGEMHTLSAVIKAEEKARRSFARDLHDGLGPLLSSIKMTISAVDKDKLDITNKKIVERSCLVTDEVIGTLKEISNNLSPHLLKNYGLVRALETLAKQIFGNANIEFKLISNIGEERFLYDAEINIYRVISELLNNSLKHSDAENVILNLQKNDNFISMVYSDDGIGVDLEKYKKTKGNKGMGIENIESRIKSLNGQIVFDTAPGKGFLVNIDIPLI